MNTLLKRTLFIISVSFNIIFILFILFAVTRKMSSVSFFDPSDDMVRYTTGACLVGVPSSNADLTLGTPEFSLNPGEEASIQFSIYVDKRQLNIAMEPLYEHEIISVEQTGFGLIIKALKPGETILQTLTGKGINNIAKIIVNE